MKQLIDKEDLVQWEKEQCIEYTSCILSPGHRLVFGVFCEGSYRVSLGPTVIYEGGSVSSAIAAYNAELTRKPLEQVMAGNDPGAEPLYVVQWMYIDGSGIGVCQIHRNRIKAEELCAFQNNSDFDRNYQIVEVPGFSS